MTTSGSHKAEPQAPLSGRIKIVQPSAAIKQEAEADPGLIRPNFGIPAQPNTQPVISSPGMSEFQNQDNIDITPSGGSKKKFLFGFISILSIVILASGYLIFSNKPDNTAGGSSQVPSRKSNSPSAFEKKLSSTPASLEKVRTFSLPIYVPKDGNFTAPIIGATKINGENFEYVRYGINSQYGRGLVPGSYSVAMFSLNSYFNPPADCGLPLGSTGSSYIACTVYDGAGKDMPAYYYKGQQPGNITNTTVSADSYLTLYVKRGKEVITIQTAGSSPAELYQMIKDMRITNPLDLPENTLVNFE